MQLFQVYWAHSGLGIWLAPTALVFPGSHTLPSGNNQQECPGSGLLLPAPLSSPSTSFSPATSSLSVHSLSTSLKVFLVSCKPPGERHPDVVLRAHPESQPIYSLSPSAQAWELFSSYKPASYCPQLTQSSRTSSQSFVYCLAMCSLYAVCYKDISFKFTPRLS